MSSKFEQLAQRSGRSLAQRRHDAAAASAEGTGDARRGLRDPGPHGRADRRQVAGWKVGATVRAVQVFEGHDGPLPGRVFADRLLRQPGQVPAQPVQGREGRVRVRLPPDARPAAGNGAGDAATRSPDALTFHPAFELAASRYAPGHRQPRRHDIRRHRRQRLRRRRRARRRGRRTGASCRSTPWRSMRASTTARRSRSTPAPTGAIRSTITAETFSDLRARGVDLPAGTFVLTGSLSLPTPVRQGQTVTAKFAGSAGAHLDADLSVAAIPDTIPLSLAHLSELDVPPLELVELAARAGFASIGLRTVAGIARRHRLPAGHGRRAGRDAPPPRRERRVGARNRDGAAVGDHARRRLPADARDRRRDRRLAPHRRRRQRGLRRGRRTSSPRCASSRSPTASRSISNSCRSVR